MSDLPEMTPFLAWSVQISMWIVLVSIVLSVVRLLKGPTLPDRIVALDLFGLLAVSFIAVYAVFSHQSVFVDAAIALALVGFFGTVAYARFVEKRGLDRGPTTMVTEILHTLAGVLLLGGAFFCFVAALGILRMQDVLIRMHASSKAGTLGAGMILLGVALYFAETSIVARCLAAIAFMIITAPLASHMIGRAAYVYGIRLWDGTVIDELRGKHLEVGSPDQPPLRKVAEATER